MAYEVLDKDQKPLTTKGGQQIYGADSHNVVKSVSLEKRVLEITGTTESRDRDGDVILVNGWELSDFLKNPVMLWAHDYYSVAIAAAEKVVKRFNPKRLDFKEVFAPDGIYPFADMVLALYNIKQLNTSSVGFLPDKWDKIEEKDGDQKPYHWSNRKYTSQSLLELSGCSVPSNPTALQNAIKGLSISDKLKDQLWKGVSQDTRYLQPEEKVVEEIEGFYKEISSKVAIEEETTKVHQVPKAFESEIKNLPKGAEKYEVEEKPYPGEHACRLKEPDIYESFARKNCEIKHKEKCIDVIYGIKDGVAEQQALRFPKDIWSVKEAKSYCSEKSGVFEAAANASSENDNSEENVFINLTELISIDQEMGKAVKEYLDDALLSSFVKGDLEETLQVGTKVGAVLNKKNKARLKQAGDLIQEVLKDAESASEENTSADNSGEEEKDIFETILDEGLQQKVEKVKKEVEKVKESNRNSKEYKELFANFERLSKAFIKYSKK